MANEKRLIDANALIAYFQEQCKIASEDSEIESLYTLAALKCCIDYFETFPTVDAVEVVHGRWEPHPNAKGYEWCSVCHDCIIYDDWVEEPKWYYCPNCGAKMNLKGE